MKSRRYQARARIPPTGPIVSHHPDRGLLGAVLHDLVVDVVEAEGQVANPLAPVRVPRNGEPVQSIKRRRPARAGQPSDLPDGQALTSIEPIESVSASQAEQGRQRDNALYQRGECPSRVCFLLARGSRTGQAVGSPSACFFMLWRDLRSSWAIRWMMSNGGLKAGTTRSWLCVELGIIKCGSTARSAGSPEAGSPARYGSGSRLGHRQYTGDHASCHPF